MLTGEAHQALTLRLPHELPALFVCVRQHPPAVAAIVTQLGTRRRSYALRGGLELSVAVQRVTPSLLTGLPVSLASMLVQGRC